MKIEMTGISNKQVLTEVFGERLQFDIPLARYTSARVGGPADALVEVESAEDLAKVARSLWKLAEPFMILGGGTNVLVSDAGVRSLVVLNHARQVRFDEQVTPPLVWAESGVNFGVLARQAAQHGLTGLEWAAGIPGSVGGAVFGNAGAHGGDMAGNLRVAEILHQSGEIESWPVEKMGYTYRSSILKQTVMQAESRLPQSPAVIILGAALVLERSSTEAVQAKMNVFLAHRRRTQPPGASMGSMFKNPAGDYAGRLIEAAGLKAARVGQAQISPLHANFFINLGQASAAEIYELIELARQTVFEKFGVALELEIELVGQW